MYKIPIRRKLCLVVLALSAAVAAGCTQALSKHPLSNEETSVIDERLIGHWRLVEFQTRDDPNLPPFVVGRVRGAKRTLEAVSISLTKNQHVKVSRQSVFSQTIGGDKYLSLRTSHNDEVSYMIFRYELTDRGAQNLQESLLRLFTMDPDFVGRSISDKKLPGKVNWYESPDKPNARTAWVRTTASPEQLTAFIKQHPQELFEKSPCIVLERIRPGWHKNQER